MFEKIKQKFTQKNEDDGIKNMSLDFKLMFIFHISMAILFATSFFPDSITQVYFAGCLALILVAVSVFHKIKHGWSWPGLKVTGVLLAVFNVVLIYLFFAFSAHQLSNLNEWPNIEINNLSELFYEYLNKIVAVASIPQLTPWFLAGLGIGFVNIMTGLNLATLNKKDFETQCKSS